MKHFFLITILLSYAGISKAQTILAPGDIMFIGLNSDPTGASGADEINVLFLEPVTTGTIIYFTDFGYIGNSFPYFQQSTNNGCSAGAGQSADGIIKWTATSAVAAGTQLVIGVNLTATGMTSNIGSVSLVVACPTVTGSGMALTNTGEVVHAFQGTINSSSQPSSVTMLASINYQSTGAPNWTTVTACATSQNISNDPGTGFEVEYTTQFDDGYYSGTMSGTKASLQAAILNISNWTFNDATGYTFPISGSFSVIPTSSTWDGSSWSNGTPTSTLDAIIASSTTPGSFTCKNLIINSGISLNTGTSNTATIYGDLTNNGNGIVGTGTLTFTKSGTQALNGTAFSFNGTVTVSAGATLTTNSKLTLGSDATNTGRIGNSAGTISGSVTQQRYIPGGRRAYRFFSHPFTTSQQLSILTDDIDITGNGGSSNGFTTTSSNNPSAFWYDVTIANGSSTNDLGWTAFTSATTTSWAKHQGIRVLVRGTPGQGLTSAAYTPSSVTLDMTGTINQGSQAISVTKGSGTSYALVGNPFPSSISMDGASKTAGIGSNFYIWSAQQGTKGGYTTYAYGSSSFNLPICGAFVTQISSNGTITFDEADKVSSTSTMFKTTGFSNRVTLNIEDSSTYWDRLQLHYDDNTLAISDNTDALKFLNPEVSFNTYSTDDSLLAIDNRPYVDGENIKLGFTTPYQKNYKIVATDLDMPMGAKLFLRDNYMGKNEEITGAGYVYWFTVDSSAASQGKNRFELNAQGTPTTGFMSSNINIFKVKLVPNPTVDKVTLYYEGFASKKIDITVINMAGRVVAHKQFKANNSGSQEILLDDISTGVYIVNIKNGEETISQKLIKQ